MIVHSSRRYIARAEPIGHTLDADDGRQQFDHAVMTPHRASTFPGSSTTTTTPRNEFLPQIADEKRRWAVDHVTLSGKPDKLKAKRRSRPWEVMQDPIEGVLKQVRLRVPRSIERLSGLFDVFPVCHGVPTLTRLQVHSVGTSPDRRGRVAMSPCYYPRLVRTVSPPLSAWLTVSIARPSVKRSWGRGGGGVSVG